MRRTSPTKELAALTHALWYQFSNGNKPWETTNYSTKLCWNDKAVSISNKLQEYGYEIKPVSRLSKR